MHVSVSLSAFSQVTVDEEDRIPAPVVDGADEPTPPAHHSTVSPEPTTQQNTLEDTTDDEPAREGLYGPMHWLDDRHVSSLLAPYLCDGWDTGDYARFADLSGADARTLSSLLPPLAREDRQNNAPRITDLLRAASRIDGLALDGYIIRAPRWDERVSIDTVCVPENAIIAQTGQPIDETAFPTYQHWLILADVLGLDDDATPPDDMRILARDTSTTRWWWAWWD